ncbi:MAG TPA: ATPase domain-containing protein [Cyanobacteria bacterium UBA11369]|nr:ATPase domain-containing protein [Cyanobacteria bacterium UBA8543]HAZ45251.1 ATPase domain-containing protein [Cyanobacteria bacterium UBA11371]HBE53162.1 ATPase domain-containing protein [Cyanobacteria bacterium UBA11369]
MTITEVLQYVDRLVKKQTGEHLDDLQKTVIQGLWQGKTYNQIADECGYDKNYVGDVSRKLFKILSEQLNEDINKSNFSWTLERVINSPHFVGVNTNITYCPFYPTADRNQPINKEEEITKNTRYHDLTLAPKIAHFCDRTLDLQTLSHWLTTQNPRLISVLGLSGIGKTALVKHFVDLNLQQFDVVIWKSIKLSQSLDTIITEIFALINPEPIQTDNKLTQLFNLLRQQRCLIILDDVQELFTSGLAGQYKTEYKDYKTFFTMMTEIEHQSTLILIAQEQCQEMLCLDEELYPVKCLELEGLNNTEILKNMGLKDEESWSTMLNLYEGNPVYLKSIANLIKNIFMGKVSEFLSEGGLILTEDIKYNFNELFDRLSPSEQQIVLELSKYNQAVSREDLRLALSLSSMDLINGLQSLQKRYLIKTIKGEKVGFNLFPVFREYVITCRQN